jgi:signal peptidase I
VIPNYDVWQAVASASQQGRPPSDGPIPEIAEAARPHLIMDFNAYNTRVTRLQAFRLESLRPEPKELGVHWVGDLMLEADVEVEGSEGELLLEVVEAGKRFRCRIDVATGEATLGIVGMEDYAPQADTSVDGPGSYHVALANVDDQLLVWIDGELVPFEGGTAYDAKELFGDRDEIVPRTSDTDPADLAPVGIGSRGAKLAVSRLQVWRDIYYIADSAGRPRDSDLITDFDRIDSSTLARLPYDPSLWDIFYDRRHVDFPLADDQFFVMGDNSAASSDARLWRGDFGRGGKPGGDYLERRLLIGKALCVYWPHSWNRIPGTPIPFPLFPNFADMRLVR